MMTTTQEKLTDRVWLLAFGAVHWRACMGEKDLSDVHEILVEEFARAEATGEPLEELRAYLAERGVSVSEHVAASESTEALETSQHPYVRRANNQVSAETEALIRELLTQGQTKSAITRALRVNRRVVIRVAREKVEMEQRRVHTGASQ
jgi:hypothetical protein